MSGLAIRALRLGSLLPVLALTVGGCANSSDSSALASPSSTLTLVTENFSGSIDQDGTAVHPFSVTNTGYTLTAGFTSVGPLATMALGMELARGTARPAACRSRKTTMRGPGTWLSAAPRRPATTASASMIPATSRTAAPPPTRYRCCITESTRAGPALGLHRVRELLKAAADDRDDRIDFRARDVEGGREAQADSPPWIISMPCVRR